MARSKVAQGKTEALGSTPGRPNVLFVVIDQLRADCLHGALADAVDLPHLRALMADSVSFSRHYTVTVPCGPARASLLTGLYAMNHRSVRNGAPLDRTLDTLPKALRRTGVEPLLLGYTDTSADPRGLDPGDPALRSYEGVMSGFTELMVMQWGDQLSLGRVAARQGLRHSLRSLGPLPPRLARAGAAGLVD